VLFVSKVNFFFKSATESMLFKFLLRVLRFWWTSWILLEIIVDSNRRVYSSNQGRRLRGLWVGQRKKRPKNSKKKQKIELLSLFFTMYENPLPCMKIWGGARLPCSPLPTPMARAYKEKISEKIFQHEREGVAEV